MRIEIHRWKMAAEPHEDGRVDVGYAVYVLERDMLPGAQPRTHHVLAHEGKPVDWNEYRVSFPEATWVPDLDPGWERYQAWLAHEERCQARLMTILHEHCPETREHERWSDLWLPVREPESLETIVTDIEIGVPVGTAGTAEPPARLA